MKSLPGYVRDMHKTLGGGQMDVGECVCCVVCVCVCVCVIV